MNRYKKIILWGVLLGGVFLGWNLFDGTAKRENKETPLSPMSEGVQGEPTESVVLEEVSLPAETDTLEQEEVSFLDPYQMPFITQAPFAEWVNPIFQNACEEASILMVASLLQEKQFLTEKKAKQELLLMAAFQEEEYGHSVDTSVEDTATLLRKYFGEVKSQTHRIKQASDIVDILEDGSVIIIPANGQMLGNPNFTPPGPINHMLVIIEYDPQTKEFITYDPGTRKGKGYRYNQDILFEAVRDYPTAATHISHLGNEKKILSVPLNQRLKKEGEL